MCRIVRFKIRVSQERLVEKKKNKKKKIIRRYKKKNKNILIGIRGIF